MKDRGPGWWAATIILSAAVIATGVLRARSDDEGGGVDYQVGEIIGATLGAVLIPALVALLIIRFTRLGRYWVVPTVLAGAVLLNAVVAFAQIGEEIAACGEARVLEAKGLVAGDSYRAEELGPRQAASLQAEVAKFEDDLAELAPLLDVAQVVDQRHGATFLLMTTTSTRAQVDDVEVFEGFAEAVGEVDEAMMGGRPARIGRRGGYTRIIATTNGCSTVSLIGGAEAPTRELAEALRL